MSDTHGDLDPKIFTHFAKVDEIWHAGDVGDIKVIDELRKFKPVRGVYGNIDDQKIRTECPEVESFMCENMKILITHIGGRPYKYSKNAHQELVKYTPDIFICGHSHILLVQFDKNLQSLWLNPGACGYKGFHSVKTILRFEVHGSEVKNMEVIELGKRV